MPAVRILIIEDERKVAQALQRGFCGEGHDAVVAASGEDGFFRATTEAFDVIVLDLNLPGRDGLQILETLRARGNGVPIVVVTARDAVADRVRGLDLGADDYLVKPFSFAELSARVRALVRRGRSDQALRLCVGDLELDLVTRRVTRARLPLSLTAREFELLAYLLRHTGHVVSRAMLARDVWGEDEAGAGRATPIDNVIDVQIARLRKKVDEPFPQRLLHTLRGVGFVLGETPP